LGGKAFRLPGNEDPNRRIGVAKKVKDTEPDFSAITKRLDAILAVLLETPTLAEGKKLSMMKRIELLNTVGLRNVEIAEIMGLKPVTIGVVLSHLRKKAKKAKKEKK